MIRRYIEQRLVAKEFLMDKENLKYEPILKDSFELTEKILGIREDCQLIDEFVEKGYCEEEEIISVGQLIDYLEAMKICREQIKKNKK